MVHRVSQVKLSRDTNARAALLKNLANDLILRERIVTTQAKAKAIRPIVEKLITRAKEDTIYNRRLLISRLGRENSASKLIELIGPMFKERPGGYTRILKLEPRTGDRAPMALIEFVENISEKAAREKIGKKEKRSGEQKEKEKVKVTAKKTSKSEKSKGTKARNVRKTSPRKTTTVKVQTRKLVGK